MLVPALVVELDEADVAFGESAGEQAVRREGPGVAGVLAVELEGLGGFIGEIGHLGHRHLHAVGEFVLGDPRPDRLVAFAFPLQFVEPADAGEHATARIGRDPLGVGEVEHRIGAGAELHALVAALEKAVAPESCVERLAALVLRDQDHERGKVAVQAAEAVADPRSHRRSAGDLRSGLEEGDRGVVVDRLGVHGSNHAQLVGDRRGVREQFAHPETIGPVLGELELGAGERERRLVAAHAGESLAAAHRVGQFLAVAFLEQRLVIEEIELRRAATLHQVDDPLRPRCEVRADGQAAGCAWIPGSGEQRGTTGPVPERRQCESADRTHRAGEEPPAGPAHRVDRHGRAAVRVDRDVVGKGHRRVVAASVFMMAEQTRVMAATSAASRPSVRGVCPVEARAVAASAVTDARSPA